MLVPTYALLYVRNPAASATFYTPLLGRAPVEESPTFVLYVLDSGHKVGFWQRDGVLPPAPAADGRGGASFELAFPVADAATVEALYAEWRARGVPIAQAPVAMDFGHTFVALDPDGHRLRVFAPG